jgi:curved DNA-binding protein CbpA
MQLKDYYKILEIEPSATLTEIKKAYRRLAQQYHPDKNTNEQYALTYFAEIKEAYEILTNPAKKDYYLQQRWYQQSIGKKEFQSQPVTPPNILKQFIELDKYVARLDSYRMDKHGLYEHIANLLSDEIIEQLRKFNEPGINKEIIEITIRTAGYLHLQQAEKIAEKMYGLSDKDPATIQKIDLFLQQFKKKSRWEKSKIYFILLATIIISLLIYLGSR